MDNRNPKNASSHPSSSQPNKKHRPTVDASSTAPSKARPMQKSTPSNSSSSSISGMPLVIDLTDDSPPALQQSHQEDSYQPFTKYAHGHVFIDSRWHPPLTNWDPQAILDQVGEYPDSSVKTTRRSREFFECSCEVPAIICERWHKVACSKRRFRNWDTCVICTFELLYPRKYSSLTFQQFCHNQAVENLYLKVIKPSLDQ